MRYDDAPLLTPAQAQNFALDFKQATQTFGDEARAHARLMPASYAACMQDILRTLVHLYAHSARLERMTLACIQQHLSQDKQNHDH